MNKEFWNQKYASKEFIYGLEPNDFLKKQLLTLRKGKILFPAEGEGRNAVFAAKLGFEVVAFDQSEDGKLKALQMAKNENVNIEYVVSDIQDFKVEENTFDYIALIFAHFPSGKRKMFHEQLLHYLKPGGQLIMEVFSKEQMNFSSGGPKNLDMLYSVEELKQDLSFLNKLEISHLNRILNEGKLHQGEASVIQVLGEK